jgi:predicted dehydrogenase
MGIQNHSGPNYAQAFELFRGGHIGPVYEVHVWTDRPAGWWPQAVERPQGSDPVPSTLDWDHWLGVAPERPFKKDVYHPFAWRGWKDFGTGAQGDMACHLMDPAVWFLELGHPLRVRSDGPVPNSETYPLWSTVHYDFPANKHTTRGPLLLTWHDGGRTAPRELLDELGAGEVFKNGSLLVGTQGALLVNHEGPPRLLPKERFADVAAPTNEGVNHWAQWVDACLGKGETTAPFSYAGHLTEIALLGNVALQFPHESLEWDGERARFPDRPEANALLHIDQRKGWEIDEL